MNAISEATTTSSAVVDIMDPAGTPQERARRLAIALNAMLNEGRFSRLASRELVALRAVVWSAASIADDLEDAQQQRQRQRPVRWWRR